MTDPAFDPKKILKNLTRRTGVYRFLDRRGRILYVGKARDLKTRVASYFHEGSSVSGKTHALVGQIADVEVTVTHTETEALLLEDNLIKKHRPRYNVLLRDDKSYPYIHVSTDHEFPRFSFYRGTRKRSGRLFGPYPSAKSTRRAINQLQKLFRLRSCTDTFFANRSRPCLQYQIQRCTAPCVDLISSDEYRRDVEHAIKFLEGRNAEVTDELAKRMDRASGELDYEQAARLRDQITNLKKAQEQQFITGIAGGDLDVIATAALEGVHGVLVMPVRGGRSLGNRTYFPRTRSGTESDEVLQAFLKQYYLSREIPNEIIIDRDVEERDVLERVFSERAGHRVAVKCRVRGYRARWRDMAAENVVQSLKMRLASDRSMQERLDGLRELLELEETPQRLECFDVSHTAGAQTVASCVVFDSEGARKADYRRFNIRNVTPGDDYAALRQAIERRYTRLKRGEGVLPDVLFVDGGRGQLHEAESVLESLQIEGVALVAVAKGSSRKPGFEQLFLSGRKRPIILADDSLVLHLIQQIRDEAHRFAVAGHRQRRSKAGRSSVLESIPGLGPKRRRELLRTFGGLQGVTAAGVDDLARVRGISRQMAMMIYELLHPET
ncbi:MAG: excinuclease ABC subunit UvrC [Gammaproteobacteria bacterium]